MFVKSGFTCSGQVSKVARAFSRGSIGLPPACSQRERARVGGPGEAAFFECDAFGLRFRFRHADPRNLGISVCNGRNHTRVECTFLAMRDFSGKLAFIRRLVRQHGLTDDVADRKNM